MMEQPERLHKKSLWSILTANVAKLLVIPPYVMKSHVGSGLTANQIRQVDIIKVTEALRLSIMTVNCLTGIGGLH